MTFSNIISFYRINPWIPFVVKHPQYPDMIIFKTPKQKTISSFKNFKTSSDVLCLLAQATGHHVECSTAIIWYFSSVGPRKSGPVKSIENLSKMPIKRTPIAILYCGIFLRFLQPWQLLTYSYRSDTTLGHQYLSTTNYRPGYKTQWLMWSWNTFSIATASPPGTTAFGPRVFLLYICTSHMNKPFKTFCALFTVCSSPLHNILLNLLQTSIEKGSKSVDLSSVLNKRSSSLSDPSVMSSFFDYLGKRFAVRLQAPGLYAASNYYSAKKSIHLVRRPWTSFLKVYGRLGGP